MDAKKSTITAAQAIALTKGVDEIYATKGKKVIDVVMAKEKPDVVCLAAATVGGIVANDAYQLWVGQYNAKLPVALEAHDTNTVSELHAQKEKVRAALNEYQDAESVLILTATATTNPVVVMSPAVLSALGNLTNIVNAYVH